MESNTNIDLMHIKWYIRRQENPFNIDKYIYSSLLLLPSPPPSTLYEYDPALSCSLYLLRLTCSQAHTISLLEYSPTHTLKHIQTLV